METKLPNRAALARYFAELGFTRGAEIGVFIAQYSTVLLEAIPGLHLILVDPWTPSRNHRNAQRLERQYQAVVSAMIQYDVEILRMTSLEAAKIVPDGTLDFVYIDALHDTANVLADLNAWDCKVRIGGMVAGHDWSHPGVTAAVESYMKLHDIADIQTTEPHPDDCLPSWYWIKNA